MTYVVVFKRSVQKDMRRIPHSVSRHIEKALLILCENPTPKGCLRLHTEGNYFRIRVGNYRIIYEVAHEIRIITVVRVGHRKDVYDQL